MKPKNNNLFMLLYFFSGTISLCWNHKHIMMSLLSLEFIILSLFCCFLLFLSLIMRDLYMLSIFLTFSVCKGVLGINMIMYIN